MVVTVSSHIPALRAVVEHARQNDDWIVIVAPSGGPETALQEALTAVRPHDASMGGRTLLMPGGGRVTVTGGSRDVAGDDYLVMTLGYDSKLTPRDEIALHGWRQNAAGMVTMGEQPGQLRIIRK
jgi:hypothetical protein